MFDYVNFLDTNLFLIQKTFRRMLLSFSQQINVKIWLGNIFFDFVLVTLMGAF